MTTPDQVANLVAWYKADALGLGNGASVATWPDSSGNSHDLSQGTGSKQPTFATNTLNGLPTVAFASASAQSIGAAFTFTQPLTLFIVGKATNAATIAYFADGATTINTRQFLTTSATAMQFNSGTTLAVTVAIALTGYSVLYCVYNGASSFGSQGGLETSGNTGAGASSGIVLGTRADGVSGFALNGNIAEVVGYSRALTLTERRSIVSYLGDKYALPVLVPASGALSLQNLVLSGQASYETASAALALQNLTLSATAAELFPASAALALQNLVLSGVAAEVLPASAALALQNLVLAATAAEVLPASAVLALQNLALSALGSAVLPASAALRLQNLILGSAAYAVNRPVAATDTVTLAFSATDVVVT